MQIRQSRGPLAVLLFVPLALLATSALSASDRTERPDDPAGQDAILRTLHRSLALSLHARARSKQGDREGARAAIEELRRLPESIPATRFGGEEGYTLPSVLDRVADKLSRQESAPPGKRDRGTRRITG